jgi:hypothetical protein
MTIFVQCEQQQDLKVGTIESRNILIIRMLTFPECLKVQNVPFTHQNKSFCSKFTKEALQIRVVSYIISKNRKI